VSALSAQVWCPGGVGSEKEGWHEEGGVGVTIELVKPTS